MKNLITIRLTRKEAQALIRAAGNTLGHDDVEDAVFNGDGREIAAARRAEQKIIDAGAFDDFNTCDR